MFTILANIFAPFSFVLNKNSFSVERNTAYADNNWYYTDQSGILYGKDGPFAGQPFVTETECKTALQNAIDTDDEIKSGRCEQLTPTQVSARKQFEVDTREQENRQDNGYTGSAVGDAEAYDLSLTEYEDTNVLPSCGFGVIGLGGSDSSILGCVAKIFYYVIYTPSSWLFAGAGIFFDFIFEYSISSDAYSGNQFVTEGWKIMRDICNIFFIFILIYIAFTLILDVQNAKSKEMIRNVIIIGLLINFSMFFAKVIIDSGNILARVFYNSEAIEQSSTDNATRGGASIGSGFGDEISLSAGLVSKVNPQEIVRNADKVNITAGRESDIVGGSSKSLGAGGFILVTFLAVIINLLGIFVFISVALIFVARVIGLWFAMIFAPFAFLSFTVPGLAKIKTLGGKSWISDLLALSFVAPLFMFMLYLILLFLEKGFGNIVSPDNTGVKFVLSIIIPFVFIMIMLLQAKKLAKEYSGSIGQSITKGVTAAAALAVGGAALGAATIGKKTVGGTLKMATNDKARQSALKFEDLKGWKKANPFNYPKALGKAAIAGVGSPISNFVKKKEEVFDKKKSSFNKFDAKTKEEFKDTHGEDIEYKKLKTPEQEDVKEALDLDLLAKKVYGKNYGSLGALQSQDIRSMYEGTGVHDVANGGAGKQRYDIETKNISTNINHGANQMEKHLTQSSIPGEILSNARRGTWDIRNLSQIKSLNMATSAMLIAAVAKGIRQGMKSQVGMDYGTGTNNKWNDLATLFKSALSGVGDSVQGKK